MHKIEKFGDIDVVIAPLDPTSLLVASPDGDSSGDATLDTMWKPPNIPEGDSDTTTATSPGLMDLVSSVCRAVSDRLNVLDDLSQSVDSVTLELTFGFEEKANIWVLGITGKQAMGLKLTWNRKKHETQKSE
jgi:hypothetical protein